MLASSEALTVMTGSGQSTVVGAGDAASTITVDAGSLAIAASAGDDDLVLKGSTGFVVTGLAASLLASDVMADIDITTEAAADDDAVDAFTITAGQADMNVTGVDAADTITVNADAMATSDRLTLDGSADFVVTHVASGMIVDADGDDAAALSGTLAVTLEASATGVDVLTGSAATTVTTSGGGDADIDASALAYNTNLTLVGAADITVTGLIGNIVAATLTGDLTVTTANNANEDTISIETGNGVTSVNYFILSFLVDSNSCGKIGFLRVCANGSTLLSFWTMN